MIVLRNLSKTMNSGRTRKTILKDASLTFPGGTAIGILGRNGAGKSTLLKMIAGTCAPSRGEIVRHGRISFPVGLAQAIHNDLTGAQNARFVARIYGADTRQMISFVADFSELGAHLWLPIRTYSSGMKARLSFAINMALNFDTYLVDEVTTAGDAAFRRKSEALLNERIKDAGLLLVSHATGVLRRICTSGAVLHEGELRYFDRIEDAISYHEATMQVTPERAR